MPRFFIEVAYKGTRYSGFQVQQNASTIQAEMEKAFGVLHRQSVELTGSSRTDAGVHAFQNYFHFDYEGALNPQFTYKMNAILPKDVVVRNIHLMHPEAHSRFDAVSREYIYKIHRFKNPFLQDTSFFYPYKVHLDVMNKAATFIKHQSNFFAFSKTNTQVKNFNCTIEAIEWNLQDEELIFTIRANRFLRGMVRLLTATLLKIGRGQLAVENLGDYFNNQKKAGYSVPAHGLFLKTVNYPKNYFLH